MQFRGETHPHRREFLALGSLFGSCYQRSPPWQGRQARHEMISFAIMIFGGVAMANLLIRDVPEDVLAGIDANAKRLGLSRVEYLRRALARERTLIGQHVGVEDLARFSEAFADLADPDIMRRAWE